MAWKGIRKGTRTGEGGLGLILTSPCSGEDALCVRGFAHSDAHMRLTWAVQAQ